MGGYHFAIVCQRTRTAYEYQRSQRLFAAREAARNAAGSFLSCGEISRKTSGTSEADGNFLEKIQRGYLASAAQAKY